METHKLDKLRISSFHSLFYTAKTEIDMPECSVCHLNPSKYTCPACGVETCSFPCVKKHKEDTKCTGTVDSTKFLAKKELTSSDTHINRDYNFLIKVGRSITVGKDDVKLQARNIFKRQPNYRQSNNNNNNNKRFKANDDLTDPRKYMVNKVFPHSPPSIVRRNNTLIIQLPQGMSRASSNKTGYDKKMGSFIWTVEWVFLDLNGEEVNRFLSYRLKESTTLKEAVPINIINKSIEKLNEERENEEEKMEVATKDGLFFYLENILHKKRKLKSMIKMASDVSISEALTDKVVLEFPTIYITVNEETRKECISEQLEEELSSDEENSSSDSSDSSSSDDDSSDESDSDDSDSSDSDDEGSDEDSDDEEPEVGSTKEVISSAAPQAIEAHPEADPEAAPIAASST